MRTIDRVKKRFIEQGLEASTEHKPTTRIYANKVDGEVEARLIALCCGEHPEGRSKLSLRLLADKMVELKDVDYISHVTVGEVLKKTNLSTGRRNPG